MDDPGQPRETLTPAGIVAAFRRIAATVVATVQNRVQLLSLELQEERSWYFHTVVIAAGALFFAGCAVVVGTIAIVIFCPESARPYVMAGFAVLYVALAVALGLTLRKRTEEKRPVLKETVEQLKKDIECLGSCE
jgi:uncharacterized membrane protein YqjE